MRDAARANKDKAELLKRPLGRGPYQPDDLDLAAEEAAEAARLSSLLPQLQDAVQREGATGGGAASSGSRRSAAASSSSNMVMMVDACMEVRSVVARSHAYCSCCCCPTSALTSTPLSCPLHHSPPPPFPPTTHPSAPRRCSALPRCAPV